MTAPPEASRTEVRKIARHGVLLGIGDAVAMAMGFVTTLLVTDHLGNDYGVFIGAQRFARMFLVIAEFGLAPLLIRKIAANRAAAGATFSNVLVMQAGLCGVYALVVMVTAEGIDYLPEHRSTLLLLVVLSALSVFATTQRSLFEGLESMGRSALVVITRSTATLVGVAVVVFGDSGLQGIVLAYIIARCIQLGVGVALSFKLRASLLVAPKLDQMGGMFREAPLFVAIGAAYVALRSLDIVMLARLSGPEETAHYGAALNFIEVLFPLLVVAQRSLFPAFSRLGEHSSGKGVIRDTLHVFSALLVPGAIGLALLSDEAVALYPSGAFADAAGVLRIIAFSVFFLGAITVCATFLTGVGRLWTLIWAYVFTLPIQVVANALLIPVAGAEGVAIATLLTQGMLAALLLYIVRARGVTLPVAGFVRHVGAGLVMAGAVVALDTLPFPLVVVIGASLYAATLLAISPRKSVERRLLAAARDWWASRRAGDKK